MRRRRSVPGLEITQAGNSQSFSIVNGAMSSTVTVNFPSRRGSAGEFTIPALTADVNGQQLTTQPLTLTVLKADAPTAADIDSGNEIAFMKLSMPQRKVYLGQMLTAQLQIYLRDDVQNFGNFQFTGQPADGFTIGKMVQGSNNRAQSRQPRLYCHSAHFRADRHQDRPAEPRPFHRQRTLSSCRRQTSQGGDPFFRQFFNQGEQKQVSLATETVNVRILPLPDRKKPANFSGAIGNFTMTAASARPM